MPLAFVHALNTVLDSALDLLIKGCAWGWACHKSPCKVLRWRWRTHYIARWVGTGGVAIGVYNLNDSINDSIR